MALDNRHTSAFDTRSGKLHITDENEAPHSGVAQITTSMNGCKTTSTGFLAKVDDLFIIVTAAHNLYHKVFGKAEKVYICLGRHLDRYRQGTILKRDTDLAVPEEYAQGRDGFDFGIISLQREDWHFDSLYYFKLSDTYKDMGMDIATYRTGYPVEIQAEMQYTLILSRPIVRELYMHYEDTGPSGNSGSPLYTMKDRKPLAVGIHIDDASEISYSTALLITHDIKAYILKMADILNQSVIDHSVDKPVLTFRNPRDRLSYQEPSNKLYYQSIHKGRSETAINFLGTEMKSTPIQLDEKRCQSRETYEYTPGEVLNTSNDEDAGVSKLELKLELTINEPGVQRLSPKIYHRPLSLPAGSRFPIQTEFTRSQDNGERKAVAQLPSILPLAPKVVQSEGTLHKLETILIRTDMLNILPFPKTNSTVRSKIAGSLQQLSSKGTILMTSSLCELLHISSDIPQPEEAVMEVFSVVPEFPLFVLCVTYAIEGDFHNYVTHLKRRLINTVRKFTNEKIGGIHGSIVPKDFENVTALRQVLTFIQKKSAGHCNPNSLFMDKKKCDNVTRSCLVAMAVTNTIPHTCKTAELRLGTEEQVLNHLRDMNIKCDSRLQQGSNYARAYTNRSWLSEPSHTTIPVKPVGLASVFQQHGSHLDSFPRRQETSLYLSIVARGSTQSLHRSEPHGGNLCSSNVTSFPPSWSTTGSYHNISQSEMDSDSRSTSKVIPSSTITAMDSKIIPSYGQIGDRRPQDNPQSEMRTSQDTEISHAISGNIAGAERKEQPGSKTRKRREKKEDMRKNQSISRRSIPKDIVQKLKDPQEKMLAYPIWISSGYELDIAHIQSLSMIG